jgi:hypothetical protein
MFPSCKTLNEKVLPCMMKLTLEFVFPYVNAIIYVIATFDLWMSKGAFDTFASMIIFKHWIGNQNMSHLRPNVLLKLILLINCNQVCFKDTN